tara:strand:+ start:2076 stop:2810 length:735 start_codon:yes stop_codon:yes gene_type:complete
MAGKFDKPFLVKGKRIDGRKVNELRKMSMKVGVIPSARGSAEVSFGSTTAVAAVHGPREVHPRHKEKSDRAIVRVFYSMMPFSTTDRCRPGPNRRSKEISKVMSEALEAAVYTKKYPATAIDVFVQISNANAGTRTTALNAASLAIANAGIEMRDLVCSVAAGKAGGKVMLDLFQPEDNFGEADLPIAMMPNLNKVVLLQMDGNLSKKEFNEAFKLCKDSMKEIYEEQKKALIENAKSGDKNVS